VLEVADVFRAHGEAYRQSHALSGDQQKVMRAIEVCRTAVLGGHLDVCPSCNYQRPSYNSCRNRHCPKCQSLPQARWVDERMARILPTAYFHVVFTLPAELRALTLRNRVAIFDLLFATASRTLLDLGHDPKRLGGQLGVTAVLHTWTRELAFHPHLHCITTGGGLSPSGERWLPARRKYLFSVKVMAKLFRGKFLDGLRRLYRAEKLDLGGVCRPLVNSSTFARFIDALYRADWVVYSKPSFACPEQVYRYLGRYTHRVGLSNQRLQTIDERGVRFATKGGKSITLEPHEFIRRFLLHVLPPRFVKIRHFGLHASTNSTTKLAHARTLIAVEPVPSPTATSERTWQQILIALTGVDPSLCPNCGARLVQLPLPRSLVATPAMTAWIDTS
jgi:hypothetical protein